MPRGPLKNVVKFDDNSFMLFLKKNNITINEFCELTYIDHRTLLRCRERGYIKKDMFDSISRVFDPNEVFGLYHVYSLYICDAQSGISMKMSKTGSDIKMTVIKCDTIYTIRSEANKASYVIYTIATDENKAFAKLISVLNESISQDNHFLL